MVKIRLRRMGAKKRPFYRIVVADSRCARDGRFIEMIGTYDPTIDPPAIKLNAERAEYWISNGAQPTDTARALLKTSGLLGGKAEKTGKVKKTKAAVKKAEAEAAAAVEEPVAEETAVEEAAAEEPAAESTEEPAAEAAAE